MGRHFSNQLFHFVGFTAPTDDERNFQSLLQILRDNCISHDPHTVEWGPITVTVDPNKSLLRGELVVPEMVCFCDIPFEHLSDHMVKYGRFGLSIDKSYAAKYGTRPVTYVPTQSHDHLGIYGATLLREIEAVFHGFRKHYPDRGEQSNERNYLGRIATSPGMAARKARTLFTKDFLAFVKPFNLELSEDDRHYFYAEKEWRRLGNIMFKPEHVGQVVIAAGYEDRLVEAFPIYRQKWRAI